MSVRLPPLLLLVVMLVILPAAQAQPEFEEREMTRSNPGMGGLFSMTSNFINTVVSYTIGDLINDNNINDFSDFSNIDVMEVATEFIGFAVCLVAGVIFIIFMPIIGCCYGCCRCCGCCGCGKVDPKKRPSKCMTLTCTGLALGTALTMFSVVICAYVSTDMTKAEISTNLLKDVTTSFGLVEGYIHDTAGQLEDDVMGNLVQLEQDVTQSLDDLPESVLVIMNNGTNVGQSLEQLDNFTASFPQLKADLDAMETNKGALQPREDALSTSITNFKGGALSGHLTGDCASTSAATVCAEANVILQSLEANAISGNLTSTTAAAAAVEGAIVSDINQEVKRLLDGYLQLENEIETQVEDSVEGAKDAISEASSGINSTVSGVVDMLTDINFDSVVNSINDVTPMAEDVADYYGLVVYSLTSVLLIVTVLWIFGAFLGTLGGSSAQKHGANMMLAGVSLVFIFSWLLMLVTTLTFALGGMVDAMLCRHIIGLDESAQAVIEVGMNTALPDFNYNVTIVGIMEDCKENAPLYQASQAENNGFNITEILDLDQYGIYDKVEEFKNISFTVTEIDVISKDLNDTMIAIDAALKTVDYNGNLEALKTPPTTEDMREFNNTLKDIVIQLRDSGETALADSIDVERIVLEGIINNDLIPVESTRTAIETSTKEAQQVSESVSLPQILADLDEAQYRFNNDLSGHITDALGVTIDELVQFIEDFVESMEKIIRNQLAPCRPIYDTFQTMTYAPCVYFLYPFNALWFTYGWCLFFSIPGLIFATKLTSYYRQMGAYKKVNPHPAAPEPYYDPYDSQVITPAVPMKNMDNKQV